ncbi:MAG: hypothetical protein ACLUZ4_08035 [Christensenellaceae bacterium]
MNISRFGIGFRFDSIENGDEREHAFNLVFSAIERADVRGLQLFAGHFPVDESDDKNIFTVAFAGGGIKQTRSLFEKLNDNPLVSGALAEYRPVVQTNALRRAEKLAFYGRFDENGTLVFNEKDLTMRLQNGKACQNPLKNITMTLSAQVFECLLLRTSSRAAWMHREFARLSKMQRGNAFPDAG